MFTKHYVKDDGTEITEYYESWYETAGVVLYIGLLFIVIGPIAIFATPFVAIYAFFKPKYAGGGHTSKIQIGGRSHD